MFQASSNRSQGGKASSRHRIRPRLEVLEDRVTPSLTLLKTVTDNLDAIRPGDTASFTITVSNDGPGPVTNIVVADQLPAAELLVWVVSSSMFDVVSLSADDFLTAGQSSLPAHATITLTVSAVIPSDFFGSPFPVPPEAGLPSGPLELDGNVLNDTVARGNDWDNAVFGDGGSSFAGSFVTDPVNSRNDDLFTGRDSRDAHGIQAWKFADSKPQAKYDIAHAYAAMYVDPTNGHLILYAGLDRYDNSGTVSVGFWFLQNPVGLSTTDPSNSGSPFLGAHTDGDILLVSDFTQDGSTSAVQVFRWVGDDSTGSLEAVTAAAGATFVIVNAAPIAVPWSFANKSRQSQPAAGEFLEQGVDLTALGLGSRFRSFLAETRSPQGQMPSLSDFVIGSFNTSQMDLLNSATLEADAIDSLVSDTVRITVFRDDLLLTQATTTGTTGDIRFPSGLFVDLLTAGSLWPAPHRSLEVAGGHARKNPVCASAVTANSASDETKVTDRAFADVDEETVQNDTELLINDDVWLQDWNVQMFNM